MVIIFNELWQTYKEYVCYEWWMLNKRRGYYRHPKTTQEMRRWYQDKEDVKLRKRRAPCHLNAWGEIEDVPSCYETKSWKKLSKRKKQWMI